MTDNEFQHGFFVRSDGSFWANAGDVMLKSVKRNEGTVYPFEGVASTPDKDREGECILQKGLDFRPFCEHGEFNWNHVSHAFVGVPVGRKAWSDNGIWKAEGEIIGGMPVFETQVGTYTTDNIIAQHNALKKAGHDRGLCMSIEGKVTQRSDCGRYVKKAEIYNIALTFRPVNPNCGVRMLQKSLDGMCEIVESDSFYKSLAVEAAKPFIKEDLEGGSRAKNKRKEADGGIGDEEAELVKGLIVHLVKKGMTLHKARKEVFNYLSRSNILDGGNNEIRF